MRSALLDPCGFIRVQTWNSEAFDARKIELALGTSWPKATGTIAAGQAAILRVGPTDCLVISAEPNAKVLH